jgi:hypothetical protein
MLDASPLQADETCEAFEVWMAVSVVHQEKVLFKLSTTI